MNRPNAIVFSAADHEFFIRFRLSLTFHLALMIFRLLFTFPFKVSRAYEVGGNGTGRTYLSRC